MSPDLIPGFLDDATTRLLTSDKTTFLEFFKEAMMNDKTVSIKKLKGKYD